MNDLDDQYRRASALDASRPSEEARRNILAHAAQLASVHGAKKSLAATDRRVGTGQRWKPALFGSLMAAALAGLLITPPLVKETPLRQPRSPIPAIAMDEPVRPTDHVAEGVARSNARARQSAPLTKSAKTGEAGASANDVQSAPAPATAARLQNVDAGAALRGAAELGDVAVLQSLLEGPADVGSRDADGRTALMLAAMHGQSDAVNALLAHGADPNTADAQGVTPLRAAQQRNYRAIVDALSRAGAR